MPRRALAHLLTVLVVLAVLPAASHARVPATFFGANWDAEIAASSDAVHDREWKRMARTGARSGRALMEWAKIEPEPGRYDFTTSDRLARISATNRVDLLPIVIYAPEWARVRPHLYASPPRDRREFARFLDVLVSRYGRTGTFWAENPQLPRRPIRNWQIWNEPHLTYQWDTAPGNDWAREYGALLRTSARVIRRRDRRARVVLAGLTNRSYVFLNHLYKRGKIRGSFDVAALHPYTRKPAGVVELAKRFRLIMRRNRDRRTALWITEVGLPASRGRYDSKSELQTTDRGMARFLSRTYRALARARGNRRTRVDRVYWYTWASVYCCTQFRYTGLLRYDNKDGVRSTPAFRAYRASVRRLR